MLEMPLVQAFGKMSGSGSNSPSDEGLGFRVWGLGFGV